MSSVRWHFEDETLHMGGRERAWAAFLCKEIAHGVVKAVVPFEDYHDVCDYWSSPFRESGSDHVFQSLIETVWAVGSRPIRLSILIHGYCEANLVFDGSAFAEVADTLQEGLRTGIFRPESQGYEGVDRIIERLRRGGAWCVLSSSVTDGFPRCLPPAEEGGEWRELTKEETVELLTKKGLRFMAGDFDQPRAWAAESFLKMEKAEVVRLTVDKTRRR